MGSVTTGAALAQPPAVATRADRACFAVYALITLCLAFWAATEVREATFGKWGAPLDDSYIHFQFARGLSRFQPLTYSPGEPAVPGATSLLWPALLSPACWLGASAQGLIGLTWLLGFGALFGQAAEVYLASRRFLAWPFAFAGGLLVLSFTANTWFAASAMEVVPLGYLLLRAARRAAEYAEGARSVGRRRELLLLAYAASLLRPEGALAALCAAFALGIAGKRGRAWALLSLGAPLVAPAVNWLLTGHAAQTTSAAKWLPMNPYYEGRLLEAVLGNVQLLFGTLLDGREWSWTFIPEGYRVVGALCLPALWLSAERRGARFHAALLCLVGLGIFAPATYETFLVNRLRYLWPFSAPWLLGLAAMGELLVWPLLRLDRRALWLGLAGPGLAGYGFAKLAPHSMADLAQSAAAITAQQVELGRWAAEALPPDARIGVNDAGAITFFSGRTTHDLVGLTTQGEAEHWLAGVGSRFEHYERLPKAQRPTHFIVYPDWFGLNELLGDWLTQRRVDGATILGGPLMVAHVARYDLLGSGARPLSPVAGSLRDELDVADLESEAAHDYVVGPSSAQLNFLHADGAHADGGRAGRSYDTFTLDLHAGGALLVRVGTSSPASLSVHWGGREPLRRALSAGPFQEIAVEVPEGLSGKQRVELRASPPIAVFHYWSYSPP